MEATRFASKQRNNFFSIAADRCLFTEQHDSWAIEPMYTHEYKFGDASVTDRLQYRLASSDSLAVSVHVCSEGCQTSGCDGCRDEDQRFIALKLPVWAHVLPLLLAYSFLFNDGNAKSRWDPPSNQPDVAGRCNFFFFFLISLLDKRVSRCRGS